MGFRYKINSGQSTIEYVLLLSVVMVIFISIIQSPFFKRFISSEDGVFGKYKEYIEHTYRYAHTGSSDPENNFGDYTQAGHPLYANPDVGGDSRFFISDRPYDQ
jgi:hypothetical protein